MKVYALPLFAAALLMVACGGQGNASESAGKDGKQAAAVSTDYAEWARYRNRALFYDSLINSQVKEYHSSAQNRDLSVKAVADMAGMASAQAEDAWSFIDGIAIPAFGDDSLKAWVPQFKKAMQAVWMEKYLWAQSTQLYLMRGDEDELRAARLHIEAWPALEAKAASLGIKINKRTLPR